MLPRLWGSPLTGVLPYAGGAQRWTTADSMAGACKVAVIRG